MHNKLETPVSTYQGGNLCTRSICQFFFCGILSMRAPRLEQFKYYYKGLNIQIKLYYACIILYISH